MHDRRRRFCLRLALELGCPNVDAMLREMTSRQLDEWIAYYQLEPFGIEAQDAEWAHWKAIYTSAHIKKGKRAPKPEKFLLFRDKQEDAGALYEMNDEDLWQQMSEP